MPRWRCPTWRRCRAEAACRNVAVGATDYDAADAQAAPTDDSTGAVAYIRRMRTLSEIRDDFQYLADSEFLDRVQYIGELGDDLPPLSPADMAASNKVAGCASQVWIVTDRGDGPDPVMRFRGQSDASTVRGLIAILLSLFSGRRASEILATDAEAVMQEFKLDDYVTARRTNGARAVIKRIERDARLALEEAA